MNFVQTTKQISQKVFELNKKYSNVGRMWTPIPAGEIFEKLVNRNTIKPKIRDFVLKALTPL
jgi:hypothetical protein